MPKRHPSLTFISVLTPQLTLQLFAALPLQLRLELLSDSLEQHYAGTVFIVQLGAPSV